MQWSWVTRDSHETPCTTSAIYRPCDLGGTINILSLLFVICERGVIVSCVHTSHGVPENRKSYWIV